MSDTTKTIVVLGASFVGLNVTHTLLKKTLATTTNYKIILIGPSTHHYWNIAASRAILPGKYKDEELVKDIRPAFSSYPESKFQFIQGLATSLDTSNKTVTYSPVSTGQPTTQSYDILILATGSRSASPGPWKTSLNGHEETVKELHEIQAAVKTAKTIAVGGGGPTGVETATEIAAEYGLAKEITLITAGPKLLGPDLPAGVYNAADNGLKKMKVEVIYSTKIVSSTKTADGKTELTLSTGGKKIVDLYISTLGMVPNSEFIPAELKNEKGEVKVNEFLQVQGAEGVWAAGDVSDKQPNQVVYAQLQGPHLVKNLDLFIKGKALEPYKIGPTMIAVTLGPGGGTGRMGNWKFPSFMVWLTKSRTLFLPNLKVLVDGNA